MAASSGACKLFGFSLARASSEACKLLEQVQKHVIARESSEACKLFGISLARNL